MANKHDVLRLLEQGLTPKQVAERLGCRPEYVRATRRRARPDGLAAERRREREHYWGNPAIRQRSIERQRLRRLAQRTEATP